MWISGQKIRLINKDNNDSGNQRMKMSPKEYEKQPSYKS